jgi:SAM-dependent methyltransferase
MGQRRDWDDLAAVDPLWAVLSADDKRGGRWDLAEFFGTGEPEVEQLLATAATLGRPARRERALDFGCGVGRLTRALATRFRQVSGVDISPRMVEQARELNDHVPNASFAPTTDLPEAEYDLVVANLVLQHLPSEALAREYIRHLVRAARSDGLVIFQLPTNVPLVHRIQPRRRVYAALRGLGVKPQALAKAGLHPVRMLAIPEAEVRASAEQAGATVAHTESAGGAGLRYYVHHRSP